MTTSLQALGRCDSWCQCDHSDQSDQGGQPAPGPRTAAQRRMDGRRVKRINVGAAEVPARVRPSEREGLCPAVHLGPAVLGHRLDRRTGERFVSREKPAQRLRLVEAAVEEHGERPMQALEDVVPVQERGGYAQRAVGALHGDQLAVAEQLPDPALLEAEAVSYFRDGQPIADET